VGKGVAASSTVESSFDVVQITTTPEALGMALELMGNGFILATLLLFAFAVRPILRSGSFSNEIRAIRRGYAWFLIGGVVLVVLGAIAQILLKSGDLAGLREITLFATIPIYLKTAAGSATLFRIAAVVAVLCIYLVGRKKILDSSKFTAYEGLMLFAMCFFEYYRAVISHATANPFYPHFSVAVNFLHLIEKDLWAGVMGILAVLVLSRRMRSLLSAIIPRAFTMLAIDFGAVAVTACYIVWLHLKTFENLFTTKWGGAFIQLLIVAVIVVGLRFYHVLSRLYKPSLFSKLLPFSISAEFAAAMLVVYFSSVVIITSPPLPQPHTKVFTSNTQGVAITLERDQYEDGMLMLTTLSSKEVHTPTVTVDDQAGGDQISIDLQKRFYGGYVFPESLLAGQGPFTVEVIATQKDGYDANATFQVQKGDFDPPMGWQSHRPIDAFTLIMILIGLSTLGVAYVLLRYSSKEAESISMSRGSMSEFSAIGGFLLICFLGTSLATSFANLGLVSPYKSECEGDGNMWHLMLPSKAGVPVSQTSREGCMWGMGKYMYMFPDKREYEFYRDVPDAKAILTKTPENPVAGIPTTLKVSLQNDDGTPATLFVDMEKYAHMVIVSEDETVFAHIHADDKRPLTQQEIDSSTFTFNYTFPKAGKYLISVDYAHGLKLESKQFVVEVVGGPAQSREQKQYPSPGNFSGYEVSIDYSLPFAGQVETLKFDIKKDGRPIQNMVPYLSAVAHIAVVKNDFTKFVHTHGEIHPPGVPYPPIIVKNGKIVHQMTPVPDMFASPIEAHVIFPTSGLYTVRVQFKVGNEVIPAAFTVRVED
jgi:hypothetical protein